MRIDKEKLNALTSMPDDKLWGEVRKIAKSYGFTLPEKTPNACEMQKLRGAVSNGGRLNLGDAVKILNEYRKREKQ